MSVVHSNSAAVKNAMAKTNATFGVDFDIATDKKTIQDEALEGLLMPLDVHLVRDRYAPAYMGRSRHRRRTNISDIGIISATRWDDWARSVLE